MIFIMSRMTFSEKLQLLIERRGWKQMDLVRRVEAVGGALGKSSVTGYLRGKDETKKKETKPSVESALYLARALEVPMEYLVDENMDEPPIGLTHDELNLLEVYRKTNAELISAGKPAMTPFDVFRVFSNWADNVKNRHPP